MNNRAELLLEDDEEEETGNNKLRQFYIRNLPSLMRIPLYSIPTEVIHIIAVQIHCDDDYPEKWREYAYSLGIRDNFDLNDIEQRAKARGVMAMHFALRSSHFHDRSFGHLIRYFLEKRLDILRLIYDHVEKILEDNSNSTPGVKRLISAEEPLFCSSLKESKSTTTNVNCSVSSNGYTASGISFVQDTHCAEHRNHDFNHSQSCNNSDVSNNLQVQAISGIKELCLKVLITIPDKERVSENSNSTTPVKRMESAEEKSPCAAAEEADSAANVNTNNLNISSNSCVKSAHKSEYRKHEFDNLQSCGNFNGLTQMQVQSSGGRELQLQVCPSAPVEESLSVLIQHTEYDEPMAEELSTALRDAGFTVRVLSEIENILMMDAIGALTAIFQEVDFIVPLVTENFLEQIRPINRTRYLESQNAINNRTLYQMYMNEYRAKRCVNFRVKPILVPGLSRTLVGNDLILSSSLRWTEVRKLIRVLRETWRLIQNLPHN